MSEAATAEFENEARNIRVQFGEQLKALTLRAEKKTEFVRDLANLFARQAELESQIAKDAEKLIEKHQKTRHYFLSKKGDEEVADGGERHGSLAAAWMSLLDQARRRTSSRATVAQTLAMELKQRLDVLLAEISAISERSVKHCKSLQEDFAVVLKRLETTMRTYHESHRDAAHYEEKLDKAHKSADSKKVEKAQTKLAPAEQKLLESRNAYLLALLAANAFMERYYKLGLPGLAAVFDRNYHETLRSSLELYRQFCDSADRSCMDASAAMMEVVATLDNDVETNKFLMDAQSAFHSHRPFEFLLAPGDKVSNLMTSPETQAELVKEFERAGEQFSKLVAQLQEQQKSIDGAKLMSRSATSAQLGHRPSKNSEDQQKMQSLTIYVEARGSFERLRCSHAAEQAQLLALAAVLGPACPPVLSPADLSAEIPEADGVVSRPRLLSPTPAAGGAAALRDARGHKRSSSLDGTLVNTSKSDSALSTEGSGVALRVGSPLRTNTTQSEVLKDSPSRVGPPPPVRKSALTSNAPASARASPEMPRRPLTAAALSSIKSLSPLASFANINGLARPAPRSKPASVDPMYFKFSTPLETMFVATGDDVPLAVTRCIGALLRQGLGEVGLFRVPGAGAEVDELRALLERGQDPFADKSRKYNSEALATCLKLYLRELPEPVVPRGFYSTLVKIGRNPDMALRVVELEQALSNFPVAHRELLRSLLPFLFKVSQNSEVNKMHTQNLALVFGPTLLRAPKDDMQAMLSDTTPVNSVTTTMIEMAPLLFPDEFDAPEAAPPSSSSSSSTATATSAATTAATTATTHTAPHAGASSVPPVQAAPTAPGPSAAVTGSAAVPLVRADTLSKTLVPPAAVMPPPSPTKALAGLSLQNSFSSAQAAGLVDAQGDAGNDEDGAVRELFRVRAIHHYEARENDNKTKELAFDADEVLVVCEHPDAAWYRGWRLGDPSTIGFIPTAYTERLSPGLASESHT